MDDLHRNSVFFTVADDFLTSAILVVVLFVCAFWLSVDLAQLAVIGLLMSRILVQIGTCMKGQQTDQPDRQYRRVDPRDAEAIPGSKRSRSQGTREIRLRHELRFDKRRSRI